jgi:pimeloyl-ACP methyl ester carboxylesterase
LAYHRRVSAKPRLILFSGLGIDRRLLLPQTAIKSARVECPDWIEHVPGESLCEYARRLAATIDPTGPLYLGGVSLGAMIALEAAQWLKPRGVFLIAGATSGDELSWLVKLTIRAVGRTPLPVVRTGRGIMPFLVRMVGRPNREQRDFLLDLAYHSDPAMTRWGGVAMLHWKAPPVECPVHDIHGERDHMIPLRKVHPPPEVVIPGGGHVINVTHAAEVNSFIESRIRD